MFPIVDCHTHIGRNSHIDASVDDLLRSMDEAKIDKSLVFAGKLSDVSNDWMLKQITPHRDRLIGVAAAHPITSFGPRGPEAIQSEWSSNYWEPFSYKTKETKKIVDWFGEGKIVACKFYVGYDHYYPADNICRAYLEELNAIGCPAIFHSGDCLNSAHSAKLKFAHPLHIDEVAVDYPNMNFVIAHLGYPWEKDAAEVCYKNSNVFADTSGFVYGKFDQENFENFYKVINEFVRIAGGTDKLLFGSDFPISNQISYLETLGYDHPILQNYSKVFRL